MDPTRKRNPIKPSPSDPFSSSSLNKISTKTPKSNTDHKTPLPIKGADPPRVDAHLQAKAMAISINNGPSKSLLIKKHQQPNKPTNTKNKEMEKKGPKVIEKADEDEKRLVLLNDVGGVRRRSFCEPEIEVGCYFSNLGAKVMAKDMPPFMLIHAVTCARKTYDGLEKFSSKTFAFTLKKEFDGVYGPAWHCIVGTSFGSFVTHSVGGFVYFSMDKLYILLFKTTVQKAE
ncbi:uncharacterized protein LOC143847984 [Tasmannia lanceolata]|uniref:uncharacterized protein LOC143847984 n=1 Tax=Tasmannia lanceolata TaxID=3420 RepID=UPI0040632ACC